MHRIIQADNDILIVNSVNVATVRPTLPFLFSLLKLKT